MRLHRLYLRDVKGVTERTINFPDSGVVVIEGPNEVGKTTLLEAFDLLLDPRAKASSRSRAVRALQPVGRDVGPRVEAEFSVGRYRVRFAKQWLRGTATELEVLQPTREQLSGEAAQHRLEAILEEALDRPLWDALRFTQAGEFGQMDLTDSAVLTEALDGASGADLHASDGAPLLELVEQEFLRYYTPTGRVGGELKTALAEATAARDEAVLAHGRVVETEELLARHIELRDEAQGLRAQEEGLLAQQERARELDAEVTAIVTAHEQATHEVRGARRQVEQARADLARREQAISDLDDVRERIASAEASVAGVRADLAAAQRSIPGLTAARDAAHSERDSAEGVREVAHADVDQLVATDRLAELASLRQRLTALHTEEQQAREALAALPEVKAATVQQIQSVQTQVLRLRARLEATSARVSLEALRPGRVVQVNGESINLDDSASPHEVPVRGGLQIELAGDLRVSVQPEEGSGRLSAELESAQAQHEALLEAAGVPDLEAARKALQEREAAETRLQHTQARVADLLGGRSAETLASELSQLEETVALSEQARPADYPLPSDTATARAVARAATQQAREAGRALEAAQQALAQQVQHAAGLAQRVEKAVGVNETLAERLARDTGRLEASRARRSDESLREAVSEANGVYARMESRAAVTRRALDETDVEAVRARLAAAEEAVAAHATRLAAVSQAQAEVQGKVEFVSGEGRQEAYDLAVAEFDRLRRALEAVHQRARAARHLRDTLTRHRDTAHQAYVRPYREAIRRLGRTVYDATFDVNVAEDLTITSRTLGETTVPFDQLSGGAREQLGILSRLAVASVVESGDGVPVIIDDALGYTDPERLERVSTVFSASGEGTQMVLLTCTPQRYAGIEGATTISLTA